MKVLLARAASLYGYPELVSELGGNPQELLVKVGLDLSLLDDMDQMMSSDSFSKLLDLSALKLNCPCFGLLLSQRQDASILGPVGLIMRQSKTFADAIGALQKYLHLHSEAGDFNIEVENGLATIKYFAHVSGDDHSRQVTDLSLGVGCNLVRIYSGKNWKPRAVYLRHSAPPDISPYTMVFRAPISFQQEFSSFVFDADILNTTVDTFEPELQRFLGNYLEGLERSRKPDLYYQTSLIMRGLLPRGNCNLQEVSRLLGMRDRALQRSLKKENTSFQQILDKVRQDMAKEYLGQYPVNLTELAQTLGYAELSVFSRAFKLWFGVAPSKYYSTTEDTEALRATQRRSLN